MIERYTTPEMKNIWSNISRLKNWFLVEIEALKSAEKNNLIPTNTYKNLSQKIHTLDYQLLESRMLEIEQITGHDVIAFLTALEEQLGSDSKYIHQGMTSSDVVDTALALSLTQAAKQIESRLVKFIESLKIISLKHKNTFCLARTHGQAAQITTFGLKMLSFYAEFSRNLQRLRAATSEISCGKISGAVGTYSNLSPTVEKQTLQSLDLSIEDVSTQVVCRDRHAIFFSTLAVMAGSVERFAVEIRHLMRSEVSEVCEPFSNGQKGSSAMPHKKNPILSENLTGLCRLIRNYALSAYENQALWHERDISHSSVERVITPDATILMDFALARATKLINNLQINTKQMLHNIDKSKGLVFSENLLLELVKKAGLLRQKAYEFVQQAAIQAKESDLEFYQCAINHPQINQLLTTDEIKQCFSAQYSTQYIAEIFARTCSSTTA